MIGPDVAGVVTVSAVVASVSPPVVCGPVVPLWVAELPTLTDVMDTAWVAESRG